MEAYQNAVAVAAEARTAIDAVVSSMNKAKAAGMNVSFQVKDQDGTLVPDVTITFTL